MPTRQQAEDKLNGSLKDVTSALEAYEEVDDKPDDSVANVYLGQLHTAVDQLHQGLAAARDILLCRCKEEYQSLIGDYALVRPHSGEKNAILHEYTREGWKKLAWIDVPYETHWGDEVEIVVSMKDDNHDFIDLAPDLNLPGTLPLEKELPSGHFDPVTADYAKHEQRVVAILFGDLARLKGAYSPQLKKKLVEMSADPDLKDISSFEREALEWAATWFNMFEELVETGTPKSTSEPELQHLPRGKDNG